jgi:glycosyltransferase involved in cell wall biosynthesis
VKRPTVVQVVLGLDPGGTERLVIELVTRLRKEFVLAVCCLDRAGSWSPMVETMGVPVVTLGRRSGFHPMLAVRLSRVLDSLNADVIHCHHYTPFVYGRLATWLRTKCRVIYTEHGRLSNSAASLKRRVANAVLMRGVADVTAVSHSLRTHMLAEGAPAHTRVVWNGIDPGDPPSASARAAARLVMGARSDDCLVASVARHDTVKNLRGLIDAVAAARGRVPKLKLVLIGDGPDRPGLEHMVNQRGLAGTVSFMGHRDDARALMAGVDIYGNSSMTEGVSLTILEAMAAELPVVATSVGGNPEVIVDGETGRLVGVVDEPRLVGALIELGMDQGLRRGMGAAGRRRVLKEFTVERMVAQYASAYRAGTSGQHRPAQSS